MLHYETREEIRAYAQGLIDAEVALKDIQRLDLGEATQVVFFGNPQPGGENIAAAYRAGVLTLLPGCTFVAGNDG